METEDRRGNGREQQEEEEEMTEGERKLMDYYYYIADRYKVGRKLDGKGDKLITLKDKASGITLSFPDNKSGKIELIRHIKNN